MTVELQDTPKTQLLVLPQDGFRSSQLTDWTASLPVRRRGLSIGAALVLFVVFGLGGLWGFTAKVGGVVTASGRVITEERNTVLQSLETSIIKSIDVKEGDQVKAGQVLARLDDGPQVAQLRAARVQQALLLIELERWRAASQNQRTFDYDVAQFGDIASDTRVTGTLRSQSEEFVASRDVLDRDLSRFDAVIGSEEQDISSLTELLKSYESQIASIDAELGGLRDLFSEGLTTRARMSTLERTLAQLQGQKADAESAIKKSRLNIQAAEEQKQSAVLLQAKEASQNMSRVQASLNQVEDDLFGLTDRTQRAAIVSPIDGTVFRVSIKSVGAVLPAGQTFIEVVPDSAPVSIETSLDPKDIGEIEVGQAVDITFSSEQGKMLQPLQGKVVYVSTDSVVDPNTGAVHYVVRSDVVDQGERIVLTGNTAQVYFRTEPKTFLQYIAEPVAQFAMRSFTR